MSADAGETLIGVVSDTHGLLRESVIERLGKCDLVIHAGDIGNAAVLEALRRIGPLVAVRGNVDGEWAPAGLRATEYVEFRGKKIYVLHDLGGLDIEPRAAGVDIVVYGHSHQPAVTEHDGVLYVNPGSAGPRRFSLPVSMAYIRMKDDQVFAETVEITGT